MSEANVTPVEEEVPEKATYPTGWLAAPAEGIEAGTPVQILSLPDADVEPHAGGAPVPAERRQELDASLPAHAEGSALVRQGEAVAEVSPDALLVNLPDMLHNATYDVVYSYASTSNCNGIPLPGVTGERVDGYADGRQPNAYLARDEFVVPCAYRTALKLEQVTSRLAEQDLGLLVFDAYRPMRAQWALSASIEEAYASNAEIQSELGNWSMNWYVANGPSGHNFGTDVDVGVCDASGNPVPMPSAFDTFGGDGHLTSYPADATSITSDLYTEAVAQNEACLALHEAFVSAGFSELASEWWHFGDGGTLYAMQSLVGAQGLDFVADQAA